MPKGKSRRKNKSKDCYHGNTRSRQDQISLEERSQTCNSRDKTRVNRLADENSSSRVMDIPGFFYDPEKKRYFKIAPNHASSTCQYTKDAINTKAAEEKRQKDVCELVLKKSYGNICSKKQNFVQLVFKRSLDGLSKQYILSDLLKSSVHKLKPVYSESPFPAPAPTSYENLEHMISMCIDENHDEILCLWSIKGLWAQRMQLVKLSEGVRTSRQSSLCASAKPSLYPVFLQTHKVTDMCWAPMANEGKHVLYTTMCHMGLQESLAVIKTFQPTGTTMFQDYALGRKATWCCAWNSLRSQFSVGAEKSLLVLNVERRSMWEYNTNKSDPLALVFSSYGGNILYSGTRRGEIMIYDMRSRSTFPVSTLHHKSSVCSISLLHNDTHLVAADFSGKIQLWDIRAKGAVLQYDGNINQYTRLPVHVDETENILYTVAEDGYTRFWSLKGGNLLHTIPPPCSISRETIPRVQLSTRWANKDGNLGLFMALKNKFHYYGTLPLG